MKKMVVEILRDGERAKGVLLNDGTQILADLVIVGAGVAPATSFL